VKKKKKGKHRDAGGTEVGGGRRLKDLAFRTYSHSLVWDYEEVRAKCLNPTKHLLSLTANLPTQHSLHYPLQLVVISGSLLVSSFFFH
jgi:hypothetical protein